LLHNRAEAREEMDEGPVLPFALAALLVERGVTEHPALTGARRVLESGEGLERWEEVGGEVLAERWEALAGLAARLG
jgi:hypothetical protein